MVIAGSNLAARPGTSRHSIVGVDAQTDIVQQRLDEVQKC
jgi:hypothetical protein